jgi:hypothetical protein
MTDITIGYWGRPEIGDPMKQRIPLKRFAGKVWPDYDLSEISV